MLGLTDVWTSFTWTLFDWASSSKLVIPVLLIAILLTLRLNTPSWSKLLGKISIFLLASYLVLATPFFASLLIKGLTIFVPQSSAEPADEIVVLSRGEELGYSRYDLAIQLWQEQRASGMFITSFGRALYMTNRFMAEKLPLEVLDATTCARTTYEEAVSTAAILQPKNVRKILLITDPPHMLRSTLTFQAMGFTVFPQMVPFPPEFPALKKSFLALREYLGLTSYAVLGRFREQTLDNFDQSPQPTLQLSNCLIEWLHRS